MLDLMRFESRQIVLRRDWESLDELVHSALSAAGARLTAYGVELRLPADLPQVHVDAKLIVQLFGCLLDNVAKYTPPGTRVTITGAAEGPIVRVTVDDDGPGLPPGDPARLFEKFQRGHEEGSIVGVGLGLAICKAIVREHGGEITARNRPGGGARFEFTLPLAPPTDLPSSDGQPGAAVRQTVES
jgi:two-component system sensor histidine kinase KdpD